MAKRDLNRRDTTTGDWRYVRCITAGRAATVCGGDMVAAPVRLWACWIRVRAPLGTFSARQGDQGNPLHCDLRKRSAERRLTKTPLPSPTLYRRPPPFHSPKL